MKKEDILDIDDNTPEEEMTVELELDDGTVVNCAVITILEVDGKDHNPNYTQDAVSYFREVFGEYEKLVMMRKLRTPEQKKAFLDPKDFVRMTEQDEDIWKSIFANMESAK